MGSIGAEVLTDEQIKKIKEEKRIIVTAENKVSVKERAKQKKIDSFYGEEELKLLNKELVKKKQDFLNQIIKDATEKAKTGTVIVENIGKVVKIIESAEKILELKGIDTATLKKGAKVLKFANYFSYVLKIPGNVEKNLKEYGAAKSIIAEVITQSTCLVLDKFMDSSGFEGVIRKSLLHQFSILDKSYISNDTFTESNHELYKKLKELKKKPGRENTRKILAIEKELERRAEFSRKFEDKTTNQTQKHIREDRFKRFNLKNMTDSEWFEHDLKNIKGRSRYYGAQAITNQVNQQKAERVSKLSDIKLIEERNEKVEELKKLLEKKDNLDVYGGSKEEKEKNERELAYAKWEYDLLINENKSRDDKIYDSYSGKIKAHEKIKKKSKKQIQKRKKIIRDTIKHINEDIKKTEERKKQFSNRKNLDPEIKKGLLEKFNKQIEKLKKYRKDFENILINPNADLKMDNDGDPILYRHGYLSIYEERRSKKNQEYYEIEAKKGYATRQVQKNLFEGEKPGEFKIEIDSEVKTFKQRKNESRKDFVKRIVFKHFSSLLKQDIEDQKIENQNIKEEKNVDEIVKYSFWRGSKRKKYKKIQLMNDPSLTAELYKEMSTEKKLRKESDKEYKELGIKPEELYFTIKKLLKRVQDLESRFDKKKNRKSKNNILQNVKKITNQVTVEKEKVNFESTIDYSSNFSDKRKLIGC